MDWIVESGRVCGLDEQGEIIAEATFYEKPNGVYDIDHTYVVPRLRGRGIADDMMRAAAGLVREKGAKVTASCSYANIWLTRHKDEFADIVAQEIGNEALACRLGAKK